MLECDVAVSSLPLVALQEDADGLCFLKLSAGRTATLTCHRSLQIVTCSVGDMAKRHIWTHTHTHSMLK